MTKATHIPMWNQLKAYPRDRAQDLVWDRSSHNVRERVKMAVRNPLGPIIRIMLTVERGCVGGDALTNLRF